MIYAVIGLGGFVAGMLTMLVYVSVVTVCNLIQEDKRMSESTDRQVKP